MNIPKVKFTVMAPSANRSLTMSTKGQLRRYPANAIIFKQAIRNIKLIRTCFVGYVRHTAVGHLIKRLALSANRIVSAPRLETNHHEDSPVDILVDNVFVCQYIGNTIRCSTFVSGCKYTFVSYRKP